MVMYLSIVFFSMILISIVNIFAFSGDFANYEIWVSVAVVMTTAVEIVVQIVFAYCVEYLPNKWFGSGKVNVSKGETRFYEKIGIKKWKDKVLELGGANGFSKKKIDNPNSPEYLHKYIVEAQKGIVCHIVCILISFFVVFVLPLKYALRIGVPVGFVSLILNLLPIFILRYNLPKLEIAYKRAVRLSERESEKTDSDEGKENK